MKRLLLFIILYAPFAHGMQKDACAAQAGVELHEHSNTAIAESIDWRKSFKLRGVQDYMQNIDKAVRAGITQLPLNPTIFNQIDALKSLIKDAHFSQEALAPYRATLLKLKQFLHNHSHTKHFLYAASLNTIPFLLGLPALNDVMYKIGFDLKIITITTLMNGILLGFYGLFIIECNARAQRNAHEDPSTKRVSEEIDRLLRLTESHSTAESRPSLEIWYT